MRLPSREQQHSAIQRWFGKRPKSEQSVRSAWQGQLDLHHEAVTHKDELAKLAQEATQQKPCT